MLNELLKTLDEQIKDNLEKRMNAFEEIQVLRKAGLYDNFSFNDTKVALTNEQRNQTFDSTMNTFFN